MGFSVEMAVVAFVTFLISYYLGWWARGKWEKHKGKFVKTSKDLREKKRGGKGT